MQKINIKQYEKLYTINPEGEIYDIRRQTFIKCNQNQGYKGVGLKNEKGVMKIYKLHRLLALTFIPNPYKNKCVDHKDNNPQNNALENLRWVTPKQNANNKCNLIYIHKNDEMKKVDTIKTKKNIIIKFDDLYKDSQNQYFQQIDINGEITMRLLKQTIAKKFIQTHDSDGIWRAFDPTIQ